VDSKVQAGILAALITATVFLGLGLATIVTARARWNNKPNDSAQVAVTPTARTADYARQDDAISTSTEANVTVRQVLAPPEKSLTDLPKIEEPKPEQPPVEQPNKEEPPSPDFDDFAQPSDAIRVINRRPSNQTEPLEVVRDFLTNRLASGESLKIGLYSDPQRIKFKKKGAVVLRVLYEVRGETTAAPKDQLFLVQDDEVKQWVDTERWLTQVRLVQQAAVAQERAMRQALATQLARRPTNC
jgi:hypothetical protein